MTKTTEIIDSPSLLTAKDFATNQDIRWCPGCGDYSILKQVQIVFARLGINKDNVVFISGIGCSSRFTYYMDTYGLHSIHGRAPAIASGLKMANPNLSVWIVTGDGDGLSIGANHLLHILRRNFNINILLFNNQIYGLTKGQYSPTSETNKVTKSTPFGSLDHPINPIVFAMGSEATFIARTMDRTPKHLQTLIERSYTHKGTSFLEIYQNCNIFNDKTFFPFTERETKKNNCLFLEHNKPLIFGKNDEKGIYIDGLRPRIVELEKEGISENDLWIHDETDIFKAQIISRFFDEPNTEESFPRPFGVIYATERSCYEERLFRQLEEAKATNGQADLDKLLRGKQTWEVK